MVPSTKKTPGTLFLIVGNSGSGKDSLIKEALKDWPVERRQIRCPQRYITRPPHETEPFVSVTNEQFQELVLKGKFILKWRSYDLDYGVSTEIQDWLNAGDNVLVNVSRQVIPEARQKFPTMKLIFVKVPYEVTSERVKSRGREAETNPEFKARLERAKVLQDQPDADYIVDNTGALQIGAAKLREVLMAHS